MPSFSDFLKGNDKKTTTKAQTKSSSFSQFLQAPASQPASTNPTLTRTPQTLDQTVLKSTVSPKKITQPQMTFGSVLKSIGKTALELPKSLIDPFINPSATEQEIERRIVPTPKNPVERFITAVPRTLAKGVVRGLEPLVEPLGEQVGTFLADPKNPANQPSSFGAFMAGATFGAGIGGTVKILGEELGTRLRNTTETLRITPDELRTKLINDEITHPQAQALARDLITKNQILEVQGTKAVEGVRGKVGKAIGGNEQAPNPQFRIIQNGEPVAGQLKSSVSPETAPSRTIPSELTYEPIQQKPLVTPEIKTSKLSLGVEAKAVASKLSSGFEGLPEYARVNVEEQAQAATNLIEVNRKQAIDIAMGRELPPEGILPEAVFTAVENHAIKTGDVELLRQLATESSLPTEATGMGQRIRMLAERNPNSPVRNIEQLSKAKEEAATRKYGDIKKAKTKIKVEIKTEIKKSAPKTKDWSSFLDELKCT